MIETATLVYLLIGALLALALEYDNWDNQSRPMIQGFIVVCLFWLPLIGLALSMSMMEKS